MSIQKMVRASDPLSSILAAESAVVFAGTHRERIVQSLRTHGPMTAHDIAVATGLTVVQVDRRLPELQRDGVAKVVELAGEVVLRDGFRVWELA